MKLHDFGLWFKIRITRNTYIWSSAIPPESDYWIYYDGMSLGKQYSDFDLVIYDDKPLIIKLKNKFYGLESSVYDWYQIGRLLTIDDFEVVENHRYKERK